MVGYDTALSQHTLDCATVMGTGSMHDNAENNSDDISTVYVIERIAKFEASDAYHKYKEF